MARTVISRHKIEVNACGDGKNGYIETRFPKSLKIKKGSLSPA